MTESEQHFISWLKARGIYNEYVSTATMKRMLYVWEACREEMLEMEDLIESELKSDCIARTPLIGNRMAFLLHELKAVRCHHQNRSATFLGGSEYEVQCVDCGRVLEQ